MLHSPLLHCSSATGAQLCLPPCLQSYSRDVFVFLFAALTVVAGGYTLKQHRTLLLHRTQTEEWKGWMQVGPCCCTQVQLLLLCSPRMMSCGNGC